MYNDSSDEDYVPPRSKCQRLVSDSESESEITPRVHVNINGGGQSSSNGGVGIDALGGGGEVNDNNEVQRVNNQLGENEDMDAGQDNVPPERMSSGPVGGFRIRMGPDGEEVCEFASEEEMSPVSPSDETSTDEEDGDASRMTWAERLGFGEAAAAVEFSLPDNLTESIESNQQRERLIRRMQRRARAAAVVDPESVPSSSTGYYANVVTRARRQPQRRRKKRATKKKSVVKKKLSKKTKPSKPPKVLAPLILKENLSAHKDCEYDQIIKKISRMTQHKVYINYTPQANVGTELGHNAIQVTETEQPSANGDVDASQKPIFSGYTIGQIQLDRCGVYPWQWKDKFALLRAQPNIVELSLYVSGNPCSSILHMKTRRMLSPVEIAHRAPPKLKKKDAEKELKIESTLHYFYYVNPVGVPYDMFTSRGLGHRKTFMLDFHKFDTQRQCFILNLVLMETAIVGQHTINDIQLAFPTTQDVLTNFLQVSPPQLPLNDETRQKEDIEWFYGQIRKYHHQEELPVPDFPVQPTSLKPQLRKYQQDAVQWMLYREGCLDHCIAHSSPTFINRVDLIEAFLNKMYVKVELPKFVEGGMADNTVKRRGAFYSLHTGYVCWEKPSVPALPSGGILCDEMGLGKTVETLCLILLNQKPVQEELKEFYEMNPEIRSEENDSDSDSSSTSKDSITYTTSSSEYDSIIKRKRKRKGNKVEKVKRARKVCVPTPIRKNPSRRAAPSNLIDFSEDMPKPANCSSEEEEEEEEPEKEDPTPSTSSAVSVIDALKQKIQGTRRLAKQVPTKRNRKKKDEMEQNSKPPSTFEKLKAIYDCALNQLSFADMAKRTPKFYGKFYEVDIEHRECFECVCGEGEYGVKSAIVKCHVCGSSQHADCVGFDRSLDTLYTKLGRKYLCPHCEALQPPFETKSTLIITPPSISHQWVKEIQRHVQHHKLNILVYKGISNNGYIPPAKLSRYDIVLTTYNVLSSELDFTDLPHCSSADGRRFRNSKRFLTSPSPLPSVLWWRVCLDEAQMVEGIGTKMSLMARKFHAIHRWCVTGTPMNKGLQDLFGLFVFLGVYPICHDIWWNALVRDPFFRKETQLLYELFGQLIWRNGKQDVLDQLGIPPQTEIAHWLNFSPVETHFYKQQFEICSAKILDTVSKLRRLNPEVDMLQAKLSSLDRSTLIGLLVPFLELRQACCHPQIVKGQLISLQKGTLTMEELLERLVKKTQLTCIDDHRLIVAALNGMAGLHIILNQWKEATEKYRQVLQSVQEHKEHFKTDSLQLLHTMENLAEILDAHHTGIPFTIRDSNLRSDAAELRKEYMKKYADAVKTARDVTVSLTTSVEDTRGQFTMHKKSWWGTSLKCSAKLNKSESLVQTIKQDLLDVSKKNMKTTGSLANKFQDEYSLENLLVRNILEMDNLRETVMEGLEELETSDPTSLVEGAIRCHLRKSPTAAGEKAARDNKCKLCSYYDNILFYESVLFKTENKDQIVRTGRNWQQRKQMGDLVDQLTEQTKNDLLQQEAEDLKATTEHVDLINAELRRGTWGDSETEVILKGILRFARINKLGQEITNDGNVHVKLLECLKKEFKFLRILWSQIYDQVSALDELSQATTRLVAVHESDSRSASAGPSRNLKQLSSGIVEQTLKIQNIHVIAYHEVETRMGEMLADVGIGHESLALHLGQLLYLKTLKRNGYGKKGTENLEDCPICSCQLGKEWSVLRCGHSFCSECVKKMCPGALQSFLCPLCRHSMKFADVSFVDTSENADGITSKDAAWKSSATKREIKGSFSTKVEAIVETLLQLQDSHPGEKCIIFSTWSDVLEIIAKALSQNSITYSYLNLSGHKFHMNLDKFKEREDIQVLLMPLNCGAKGLNITEATHVLMVEPILNLANELQAIGRVHRIGQSKPTFVHRFYIKRTIEDNLFQILKAQDICSDDEGSLTVQDLQNLVAST